MLSQRQSEILDNIRIFMELSEETYDKSEVKRILELVQAGATPEMMVEDMELSEEKVLLYLTVMGCLGLIRPAEDVRG